MYTFVASGRPRLSRFQGRPACSNEPENTLEKDWVAVRELTWDRHLCIYVYINKYIERERDRVMELLIIVTWFEFLLSNLQKGPTGKCELQSILRTTGPC